MTGALIRGALGDDHRVDMEAIYCRLDEFDDGRLASTTVSNVTANLRRLADDLESEVLALRDHGERLAELDGSPSIGAVDVPPPPVSDPIVGDAPGAPAAPVVDAPGAPSLDDEGAAMTGRYIATSASGEHVVRTDSPSTAAGYATKLRGRVIDTLTAASKRLIDGIAQEIGEEHPDALSRLDILDGVGRPR